jgi:DNA topoisomerase-1
MTKTLVIVESPHKAEKIQEFLGKNYLVMASKGHITELAKGGKFGLGVDIDNDFKPRYMLMDDKIDTLNALIKAAKQCDQIILATDPDREGEAISWHLAQRLEDCGKPIKRMTFGLIKKDKILKALKELRDVDMDMVHSQEARRILDRLVGFMASPFLMNFFGPKLSAGRVQSVVTRMIIDRERDIESFIPEEFWTINATLSLNKKDSFITKYPGKLTDLKTAENMRDRLSVKDAEYIVSEVISEEEKKYPPQPLITSTLQRIMSKKHNFGADQTMKAAQALYESGYCTYIRTDSVRADDEAIEEAREFIANNKHDIPKKPYVYKNKDNSQDAHECIRPSDINLLPYNNMAIIDPDEKLVYETIWKYFIASQMMPAIYSTLKITAHVNGDQQAEVKASGKALKYKGYLEVLGGADDSKIEIPNLIKGDICTLYGTKPVKIERKQTQPLPRFSEDKLIQELDSKGIGRPATYADLLSKICTRNYVEKDGNVYHATDLGKKITDILKESFKFLDYNFTSKMEEELDLIASGKLNHIDMLKKFYPPFKKELNAAYVKRGSQLCEKCTSPMAIRTVKKTGEKFLSCTSWPKCNNTKQIQQATPISI